MDRALGCAWKEDALIGKRTSEVPSSKVQHPLQYLRLPRTQSSGRRDGFCVVKRGIIMTPTSIHHQSLVVIKTLILASSSLFCLEIQTHREWNSYLGIRRIQSTSSRFALVDDSIGVCHRNTSRPVDHSALDGQSISSCTLAAQITSWCSYTSSSYSLPWNCL